MPYTSTRRLYSIFNRKASRYFMYKRARKLFNEIIRDISAVESRMLKVRGGHA